MINPKPVDTPRSPYSEPSTVQTPPTAPPSYSETVESPKKGRRWKRIIGLSFLAIIMGGFVYGYTQYRNLVANAIVENSGDSSAILGVNSSDAKLDPAKFTKAGDGRFTMVLVGVGGENHPGGKLTDSIQVLSIDTINKKLAFTSIPRDLYVTVQGSSKAKINAVYTYAEQRKTGSGPAALKEAIAQVTGLKITNFALVDFTGIKQIVDTLGGVQVNVEKDIYDPSYPADDMIHYSPFSIKAGLQTLNGETALKYVRSRHSTSDFDRSKRQQQVLEAIKKKAMSAGVLGNPAKVTSLIEALGKHFKTDLQPREISQLLDLYKQIDGHEGYVLDTSSSLGLLSATTDPVAGYISYPTLGVGKYDDIHQWFQKNNPDPLIKKDAPTITVYGTSKSTAKQLETFAQTLRDYGYTVTVASENAPAGKSAPTFKIMARNPDAKPIMRNYLSSMFGKTIEKGTVLSTVTTDFEIIYVPTSSTSASASTKSPKASPSPSPTPTP